ncbi:carbonic anhydrase [Rhodobacterales bacterium HKCCE2091]|nr:carbonic anhydrase [Rhodobacterales bacterium HKCCE2091]
MDLSNVSSLPPHFRKQYHHWLHGLYANSRDYFRKLADEGQTPSAMVVACCDSRVTVESLLGPGPGEIFVHRNIANLVPTYLPDGGHHGTGAAIEFGVGALKVKHLIVMGHSRCGGVQGCREMCEGRAPHLEGDSSLVGRWLDEMRPAFQAIDGVEGEDARQRAMEFEGVKVSLRNLLGYPVVAEAVKSGQLSLHGLWIEIGDGDMEAYDGATDTFSPL